MHEGLKYKNWLCRNARGLLGFLHQSHPLSPVTGAVAVEGQDPLLLRMTRLLENGRGRFTVEEPWVMLLQDVPDVFRHVIELECEKHRLGFEVAGLQDEQHEVRQNVMAVSDASFFRREGEERFCLASGTERDSSQESPEVDQYPGCRPRFDCTTRQECVNARRCRWGR